MTTLNDLTMLTVQLTVITGGTHTSFFFLLSLSFFGIFTNSFCAWEGRRSNSGDAPAGETPLLLLTEEDGPRDAHPRVPRTTTKDASEVRASPARGASPRCSHCRSCSPWLSHVLQELLVVGLAHCTEPRGGREPQCPVAAEGEEGVGELWLTRGRRRRREEAGAVVLLLAATATAPMMEDVAVVFS